MYKLNRVHVDVRVSRSYSYNLKKTEALDHFCRINQTMWSICTQTIDVTHWTGTQQHRPELPTITPPDMQLIHFGYTELHQGYTWWYLVEFSVHCINRMPGGVTVGDSGLCWYVPVQCVILYQLFEHNYFPLFVGHGLIKTHKRSWHSLSSTVI